MIAMSPRKLYNFIILLTVLFKLLNLKTVSYNKRVLTSAKYKALRTYKLRLYVRTNLVFVQTVVHIALFLQKLYSFCTDDVGFHNLTQFATVLTNRGHLILDESKDSCYTKAWSKEPTRLS